MTTLIEDIRAATVDEGIIAATKAAGMEDGAAREVNALFHLLAKELPLLVSERCEGNTEVALVTLQAAAGHVLAVVSSNMHQAHAAALQQEAEELVANADEDERWAALFVTLRVIADRMAGIIPDTT